ncbi:basic leucine zipper transcriptional factor ATF-like [Scleropages formosus]|uniref:Basic leucine zipper transcriptional factor ATF-like n=1 Tax=Scleropages formosus TaxID=113540 RepID=A0A0P7ULL1_SCLFO|nr:basic leucine zipper transcriptional factor ATF-like [Scleropages formosus]
MPVLRSLDSAAPYTREREPNRASFSRRRTLELCRCPSAVKGRYGATLERRVLTELRLLEGKERKDSSDDVKKVMRREKNRIAAQKSRLRQTQKADSLHLESESLEKENAALRKEVKQLDEEAKYLSSVLSSHEPLCSALLPQSSDILYSPHQGAFHQPHVASRYQH